MPGVVGHATESRLAVPKFAEPHPEQSRRSDRLAKLHAEVVRTFDDKDLPALIIIELEQARIREAVREEGVMGNTESCTRGVPLEDINPAVIEGIENECHIREREDFA